MHDQQTSLGRLHLPALGWALLCAFLLHFYGMSTYWIFADDPIFSSLRSLLVMTFHVAIALFLWLCILWLSPLLQRCYPRRIGPRLFFGMLCVFAGVVLINIAVYLHLFPIVMGRDVRPAGQFDVAIRALMVAEFVYGWLLMRDFSNAQAAQALHLQQEADALATDLDRSELAMLEAQIEPHFLFNTLAHVKRLYRIEEGAAAHRATRGRAGDNDRAARARHRWRGAAWSTVPGCGGAARRAGRPQGGRHRARHCPCRRGLKRCSANSGRTARAQRQQRRSGSADRRYQPAAACGRKRLATFN